MLKRIYSRPVLLALILTVLFLTPHPSDAVLLLNTREEPGVIDKRSREAAAPYEQVCCLEINNSKRGSGTLIGKKGRELYLLTAGHNVWDPISKIYHGSIDVVFTLINGHQITCPALQSYIPMFAPSSIFDDSKLNLKNDIAIVKCLLPAETEFNVKPLLLGDSEDGPINRYEGKFIGYGYHGINGSNITKLDANRRLGETNLIEYRENSIWNIMCILPARNDTYGSFSVVYDDMDGMSLDLDSEFVTKLEMKNEKLDLDGNLFRAPFDLYDSATILKQKIHPRQGRIMSGDSGGPLIVTQKGSEVILGVTVCQKYWGGLYFDNFTPISYYKKWIEDILVETSPEKTSQYVLTPNMHLGLFRGQVLEFTTKFGTRGFLNSFIGVHFLHEKMPEQVVTFDKDQQLLKVDETSFKFSIYKKVEEACLALMDSGLFEKVEFGDKELPAEALAQPFFKELELFVDRINFYPRDLAKDAFERFSMRFRELKERGLSEGQIPEKLKAFLIY